MRDFDDLKAHLDESGRLTSWPSPRKGKGLQELALEYLARCFEIGRHYSEREVNDLLNSHHTFGDPALLRRELYERGYLRRLKDGTRYWREAEDDGTGGGSRSFG